MICEGGEKMTIAGLTEDEGGFLNAPQTSIYAYDAKVKIRARGI
jgi:hypothetical protein